MRAFLAVLLTLAMLAVPLPAIAGDMGPQLPVDEVELVFQSDFEPVIVDGYEYTDPDTGVTAVLQGVLLSESSYKGLLFKQEELKLGLDFALARADSWEQRWIVDMQVKDAHIGVLEVQLHKTNTFFARNKGGIGFGLGVAVTVISSIGMAYAFAGAGNVAGGN